MKTIATYQGTTKEDLQLRILNIENMLLNNEMEAWESKEYKVLIGDSLGLLITGDI